MAYLHGAYGQQNAEGSRVAADSQSAIVIVGTAPVHTVAGGAANVNKPLLMKNFAEAKAALGYSDNWADYTLCEAMELILMKKGVGPLVLVNVLDPATHRASAQGSVSLTPANGRVVIANAAEIILDTVAVAGKTAADYVKTYNSEKETITLTETSAGSLGTDALTITYNSVDPAAVTDADVAGTTDGMGQNTGVYIMKNVYEETGMVPMLLLAPGFSSHPAVHAAMAANSRQVNGHWDAFIYTDIPIVDAGGAAVTLATAANWKKTNGYTLANEVVSFPMFKSGTSGVYYHASVLRAANLMELLTANDGIPYESASNTAADLITGLWLGAAYEGRVFDDSIINEHLNKHGIASAAYVGGRWAIWGAHTADYDDDNVTDVNVAETNLMMLFYITNDFQIRRFRDVDRPLTANDVNSIAAEEQERLDALTQNGMLTYGRAYVDAQAIADSDVFQGDYVFSADITTTPLAKSLTLRVNWVNDGYAVYYQTGESDEG